MKKILGFVLAALLFLTACGPAKPQAVTYEYTQDAGGLEQTVRETVAYQGQDFHKLDVTVSQEADESIKVMAEGQDFQTVKDQLLAFMESNQTIQELKETKGVTASFDLTEEYVFIFRLVIDMETVDAKALGDISEFGIDLSNISEMSPQEYIKGLEANGAKKVAQ